MPPACAVYFLFPVSFSHDTTFPFVCPTVSCLPPLEKYISTNFLNKEIIRQSYLFDLEKTKSELSGQQFDPTYDLENDNLHDPFLKIKEFVFSQDLQTEETFKPSKYGKLLLFGSFLLMSVLTLFTFVWGVL